MAAFWNQVYPGDVADAGLYGSDVVAQTQGATAPIQATQTAPGGSGPTISLLVVLGILVAVRLLLDRGVRPGA